MTFLSLFVENKYDKYIDKILDNIDKIDQELWEYLEEVYPEDYEPDMTVEDYFEKIINRNEEVVEDIYKYLKTTKNGKKYLK